MAKKCVVAVAAKNMLRDIWAVLRTALAIIGIIAAIIAIPAVIRWVLLAHGWGTSSLPNDPTWSNYLFFQCIGEAWYLLLIGLGLSIMLSLVYHIIKDVFYTFPRFIHKWVKKVVYRARMECADEETEAAVS